MTLDTRYDEIWLDAAAALGIRVRRGGDAYVHFDGTDLHLADDSELDADDTVAQLVLHELCHALVQGPEARHLPDWGLDNTSARDDMRERACVRLQAHLTGAYGLRELLYPTTVVRAFFDALSADAFAGFDEESAGLAREAALRASAAPFGPVLRQALGETARRHGRPLHPRSGLPLHGPQPSDARCGSCVWRSAGGLCRVAARRVFVQPDDPACTRWEGALDCRGCGACCRSAYDSVTVTRRDLVVRRHPELVRDRQRFLELARVGDRCAALEGPTGGPYHCRIYADRPKTCRDFEAGGRHCLEARRRVGLGW